MGCGSSTRTTSREKDRGYEYDYKNNTNNAIPHNQYGESWVKDGVYYGDQDWDETDYRHHSNKSHGSLQSNQKSPTIFDEHEDDTPFDDDGVLDYENYSRMEMGFFTKIIDFRSKFGDEKQETRPHGCPNNLYVDTAFPLKVAIVKDIKGVEWKRPKEFLEDPRLFVDGATCFDIGQGSAGTCWFLSIVANIADNKEIMKQVIPASAYTIEDKQNYDGVFHARFFNFGRWEDVYIDDFMPVVYGNKLWGAKSASDNRELWVALLEKAFARMHGSYDAIYGGQPGDANLLLTGGFGERIDLQGNNHDKQVKYLHDRIKNALGSGCHVSSVVLDKYDNYKGLVGGHAYSVIGVAEDKASKTKLIQIRNPWGKGEWQGTWCDWSPEQSTVQQKSAVKTSKKEDGIFYISTSDFIKYFAETTICSLTPDFDCDGRPDPLNHVLSIYGEWDGKTAAGFHNLLQNQRFAFTVTEHGLLNNNYMPLVVQIMQKSKKRRDDNLSIRCDIFRVIADRIRPNSRRIALEILGTKNNIYTKTLQTTFRHKLKPGRYVIIASTADKGQEKAFLLRLFTPAPLQNIKEIPMKADVVSCGSEDSINIKDRPYELTFEKVLFGEFVAGNNAGGQVSNRDSYYLNPQYLITIPEKGSEIPLVIHIMQSQVEPMLAVGIRIFQLDKVTRPPVDTNYLYDHYDDSPSHLEGTQFTFVISYDVVARYLLKPGRYIALVHLDKPKTEQSFCIAFKSTVHVGIKGFQTG